ncbi:MAG: hypothetical protein IPG53_09110 [Ignavibacteriales bacterium]|nr:hypothetical protein [Ignavibacteriales bacterium]
MNRIKSSDNLPYIPGTSIKGAVRTALAANAWLKLTDAERAKNHRTPNARWVSLIPKVLQG